jgi:multiple sugar transport system ATP-binding protein
MKLRSPFRRDILLGVPPEDLTMADAADLDHPCFDTVIEVIEQPGSEFCST